MRILIVGAPVRLGTTPLLDLARCHFGSYEARRKREQATA